MKRVLIPVAMVVALGLIFWVMVRSLQTEGVGRDEPPAIILRAPDGFDVEDLGPASLASAAAVLVQKTGAEVGARFTDQGDTVILLADRLNDRVVEMRASKSGTIVERQWPGEIERRLNWAVENGDFDVPGLAPSTGKNLYH